MSSSEPGCSVVKAGSRPIGCGAAIQQHFNQLIEAKRRTDGLPLWIDDTPALTVAGLRTRARRLKRRHGLDLVVIDYLQLLRPARKEAYAAVHAELIKALCGDRLPTLPLHVIARNA
jgi:replicative DNA helicase